MLISQNGVKLVCESSLVIQLTNRASADKDMTERSVIKVSAEKLVCFNPLGELGGWIHTFIKMLTSTFSSLLV